MQGKDELIKELELLEEMANENPCGMKDVAFTAIAAGLRALVGRHCEKGMSMEQTALYFGVSTKTIERWQADPELEFPNAKRYGHLQKSFPTDKIVKWAIDHPDKRKKKEMKK